MPNQLLLSCSPIGVQQKNCVKQVRSWRTHRRENKQSELGRARKALNASPSRRSLALLLAVVLAVTKLALLLGQFLPHVLLLSDSAVAVEIRLADLLVELLVSSLLARAREETHKIHSCDEAVAVAVHDLEVLNEVLLGVGALRDS